MFDTCLYFNTTALARVLEREWTKAFQPFGLTPAQAFMLRAVLAKPGLLQSELAGEMVISRSTATRTLDGLQKLNLLERVSTQTDGRESAIHPTLDARNIAERLNAASAEVTRRMKKALGTGNFDDTVKQLKNTRTALK